VCQTKTLPRTLGQLALALLNATLLLALAVLVAALVLVSRVQGFATDTARAAATAITPELRARVDSGLDRAAQGLDRLEALQARLAAASADDLDAPQLQALRSEVAALTAQLAELNAGLRDLRASADGGLRAALRDALTDAAATLGPLPPTKDTP
jgi:hypothetical protein